MLKVNDRRMDKNVKSVKVQRMKSMASSCSTWHRYDRRYMVVPYRYLYKGRVYISVKGNMCL